MRTRMTVHLLFIFVCCAALSTAAKAQTISLQFQSDVTIGNANLTPRPAVGDVNNDGFPDVVTLNKGLTPEPGPLSVFLNNGAGGFASHIVVNDSLSPNAVVIRDFNHDGYADLAIAGDGIANGVNIRLGNGTGNFPGGTFIAPERGSPVIASADWNGDGHFDIATCTNINELRVMHGNGAGGFGGALSFATANNCTDMAAADFNVDGRPDIAVASRFANNLQIFLNNGAGGFSAPVPNLVASVYKIVVADFNRDCVPDVAATQFSGSIVFILIGNRQGGFSTGNSMTLTSSLTYLSVGDFNRDKKIDLALRRNIISSSVPNLIILPGTGAGGFGPAYEQIVSPPTNTVEMQLVTWDGNLDGRDDLIVGREGGFLLYRGNSAPLIRTENDFDGDGRSDLGVFRPSNGVWYLSRSTNGFLAVPFGIATDRLVPADYDGDFKTDIAIWREGSPGQSGFWILQSSTNTARFEQFGQTGDEPGVVADWDGDGRADPAVYRNGAAGQQSFFFYRGSLNNPGGNVTYLPWGTGGDRAVRGDFDGDGRADAAVFRPSNAVWYILQSSNGQLLSMQWGLATDKSAAADYDGDGRTDFAVFRPSDNSWYILNSATSTFVSRQWGLASDALTPADYNGDGRSDVAVYRPSNQHWYIQQCADFGATPTYFGAGGDVAIPSAYYP